MDEIGNVCPARPPDAQLKPQPHEPSASFRQLGWGTLELITGSNMTGLHVCKHCGVLYWAKGLQPSATGTRKTTKDEETSP